MSTFPTAFHQPSHLDDILPPTASSPFRWLLAGLHDMLAYPVISAVLGLAFTALCVLAYWFVASAPMFSATALVVLLLTGPYLAAAAYHVPLQRERADEPGASACIEGVRNRFLSIGLFAIVCALLVAAFTRLAGIAFALYYSSFASGPEIARIWTSGQQSISMLVFLVTASAVLVAVLFAVSAISLPLLVERNTDVITAMRTSLRTLRAHKLALALWVTLILVLTAAAILSQLVLMPVVFPLLAYATWHSYRQLGRDVT